MGFNTASGMRSHVTKWWKSYTTNRNWFQYRKRYEITCDVRYHFQETRPKSFQYRKRYEITCDQSVTPYATLIPAFQYRKRYEITCDIWKQRSVAVSTVVSIPQAV